jgi:hypothetical protein
VAKAQCSMSGKPGRRQRPVSEIRNWLIRD